MVLRMDLCACRSSQTVYQLRRPVVERNSESDTLTDSTTALLNTDVEPDSIHVRSRQKKPSLLRALMRVFGPMLLWAHLCKLAADILTFIAPLLQRSACKLSTLLQQYWCNFCVNWILLTTCIIMAALCNGGIIFLSCAFYLSSSSIFFFIA